MGWFENQIELREQEDARRLEEALRALAGSVTGRSTTSGNDAISQAKDSLSAVLAYYGAKAAEPPRGLEGIEALVEFQSRETGVMNRLVKISGSWYADASGAMLGFLADGTPVALLPSSRGGYVCRDPRTGETSRLTKKLASEIREEAYCFYRPLNSEKVSVGDLLTFMARCLDKGDWAALLAANAMVTVLGAFAPVVNSVLFGPVLEYGSVPTAMAAVVLLSGALFSQALIQGTKAVLLSRISSKLGMAVQAAAIMRTLSLKASFFRSESTGELAEKIVSIQEAAKLLQSSLLSTALGSLFSLAYLLQIWLMAPSLAVPSAVVTVASLAVLAIIGVIQAKVSRRQLALGAQMAGLQYSLIGGIQKIKTAGAESRAFSLWADVYHKQARLLYNGPLPIRLSGTLQLAIILTGTIATYVAAATSGIGLSSFMAFSSAFGMLTGGLSALSPAVVTGVVAVSLLEMAKPIFEATPEPSGKRGQAWKVKGSFEFENVTFAYRESGSPVLSGLSFKVRPGEYVAFVGKSGCGKSTLIRLLLGFEEPQKGAVYCDGRNLKGIDLRNMRKGMGVVLQNGALFPGSIYENISIAAPGLSIEGAWEALEVAGMADEVRAMPMGLHTFISEGGGGISGGQRQRLMIARAVASKPKVLVFDEATSALDNITQKKISCALDAMGCTRIVIAHRLSTIKHCDRIMVLEGGRIVEEGSFEELLSLGGSFVDLAKRQMA